MCRASLLFLQDPFLSWVIQVLCLRWFAGGCNRMYPVQHYLVGTPPHVFTMQLAWQSNNEKGSEIKLAMEALSQVNSFSPVCNFLLCYACKRLPSLLQVWCQ